MKSSDNLKTQSSTSAVSTSLVAWIQRCCKAFTLTFIALVLMTIGFCLIMAGWFTPPTNDSVHHVRLAGPIAFGIGFMLLICSCLVCGIDQRRCCMRCTNGASHNRERSNVERAKSSDFKAPTLNQPHVKRTREIPDPNLPQSRPLVQQHSDVVGSGNKERFRHPDLNTITSVCEIHAQNGSQDVMQCNIQSDDHVPTNIDYNTHQTRALEELKFKRQLYQQESEDKGYYDRSTPNCSEEEDLKNSIDLEIARSAAASAFAQHRQSTLPSHYYTGITSTDRNLTTQIDTRATERKQCEQCLLMRTGKMESFSHEKIPQAKTFQSMQVTTAPAISSKRGLRSARSIDRDVIEPRVHSVSRDASSKRSEMLLRSRSMPGASEKTIDPRITSDEMCEDSRHSGRIYNNDVKSINKTASVEADVRYSRPFCPVHDTVVPQTRLFKPKMLQHKTEKFISIDRTQLQNN